MTKVINKFIDELKTQVKDKSIKNKLSSHRNRTILFKIFENKVSINNSSKWYFDIFFNEIDKFVIESGCFLFSTR